MVKNRKFWNFVLMLIICFGGAGSAYCNEEVYKANNDNLKSFFTAFSASIGKPFIVSKLAARKSITGTIDMTSPGEQLERLSSQLGLIWYFDGTSYYVYDASETQSVVLNTRNVKLKDIVANLVSSGLYDEKYPLRGEDDSKTFYISGPPVYIKLMTDTVRNLDERSSDVDLNGERIGIVHLENTFVDDRVYSLRDQEIVIPGMATVIEQILQNNTGGRGKTSSTLNTSTDSSDTVTGEQLPIDDSYDIKNMQQASNELKPLLNFMNRSSSKRSDNVKVVAYPATNSLLIRGESSQVSFIESIIKQLDYAKRHIELSLWIIDLDKSDLDQLGVSWTGSVDLNSTFGVIVNSGNTSFSTLDTTSFLATVQALEKKQKARIISRPVVLTQENIPAIFDNNKTFYVTLVGERTSSMEHVTYGTLISVLPRFSSGNQIEMVLNIEDGNDTGTSEVDSLPQVGRTVISTVARVPQGKSLLIGGYTRDSDTESEEKVPLLGDLPYVGNLFKYKTRNLNNTIRFFLIQPREINESIMPKSSMVLKEVNRNLTRDDDPLRKWVDSYLNR